MNDRDRDALIRTYRDDLIGDTLPFWLDHALDHEHGGYLTALDQRGQVIDTDKGMWVHGRFLWLLSMLYTEVEPRAEWLAAARHGLAFLDAHGFDQDGRMFFLVTRDGQPLRKRRYLFTECYAIAGFAAHARATGDAKLAQRALALFRLVLDTLAAPPAIPPKWNSDTRPMKGFAIPMILLITAQTLRQACADPLCDRIIERSIDEIARDFVKPELGAVLEVVGPAGEFLDHFDGRMLNPGHAIEAAWFVLAEAHARGGDAELVRLGTTMLDLMWRRGWDPVHGGLLYNVDVKGHPVSEYWHDMKFWWPHNEAVLACLWAWRMTGERRYLEWHRMVHDWAHAHFADREHGEWFGYLHRDGSVSSTLKGNLWKGPFHLPRMQLLAWQLLDQTR